MLVNKRACNIGMACDTRLLCGAHQLAIVAIWVSRVAIRTYQASLGNWMMEVIAEFRTHFAVAGTAQIGFVGF